MYTELNITWEMSLCLFLRRKGTLSMLHHAWWTLSPKKSVDPDRVCTTVPIRVQNNASFIVDMGVVKNPLDLRADDNGA